MKPFRISRRHLLRGAAGVVVGLPLLEVMQPLERAVAQAASTPKRLVVFYEQTGYIYNQWKPTGTAENFQLSPTLSPLEPFKSKVTVIDGLTNSAALNTGDDHQKGMGSMLTGTEISSSKMGGGISLDQYVASKLGTSTKFKSIEAGVLSGSGDLINWMSHAGANQPITAVSDPAQIFSRIFSSFQAPGAGSGQPDSAALALVAQHKSVLDAVKESYSSVLPKVSSEDRQKLDAHLTSIREIEKALTADPSSANALDSCVKPTAPTIDSKKNDNMPAITKLQIDLVAMAMICDLTRVGTIQVGYEAADPVHTWLGHNRGHHAISHDADSNAESQKQLAAIDKWHAEQFSYLLGKLNGAAEGAGTVLDNSVALWVNGLAKGNIHSHGASPPQPIVTAGGAGGKLATGRYLTAARGINTNDVYIAILQALGIEQNTFGNAQWCKGPLSGLLV